MATVVDLIQKLKTLPFQLEKGVADHINAQSSELEDLNIDQMRKDGVDANGESLGEYSGLSKQIRQEAGLQIDYIDLRFTGDFQRSIQLKQKKGLNFTMTATDPKWKRDIEPRWPNAVGLTSSNEKRVDEMVKDAVKETLTRIL